MRVEVEHYYY